MIMKLFSSFVFLVLTCDNGIIAIAKDDGSLAQHGNRQMLSSIIELADKIQNAVPTAPTTPMPTSLPTFSGAPSPSPSETPTFSPTTSSHPSISPTIAPTVSAAPTLSPTISSAPSINPSMQPTELPSFSPSENPTMRPTRSAAPSSAPSISPSEKPSSSPSMAPTQVPSIYPSEAPTIAPTVSAAPSLLYRTNLHITTVIPLHGISSPMNVTQTQTFQDVTRDFVQQNMVSDEAAVIISTVTVENQHVAEVEDNTDLMVEVRIAAEYESLVHPDHFDFKSIVEDAIQADFSHLKSNLLDSGESFFLPLDPAYVRSGDTSSPAGYIAVIVCSIVASVCAIVAAYYAIRRSMQESDKGDKLGDLYSEQVDSQLTQEEAGITLSKSIEIIQVSDSPDKSEEPSSEVSTEYQKKYEEPAHQTPQKNKAHMVVETINGHTSKDGAPFTELLHSNKLRHTGAMSPNTMEAGTRLGALAESILRSESFGSSLDPPTEQATRHMYTQKANKTDPAAKYRTATYGVNRTEQRDDVAGNRTSTSGPQTQTTSIRPQKTSRDPSVVGVNHFISAETLNSFFPGGNKRDPEQREADRNVVDKNQRMNLPKEQTSSRPTQADPNKASAVNARQDHRTIDWPNESNKQDQKPASIFSGGLSRAFDKGRIEPPSPASSAVSSGINAFLNMVGGTLGAAPLASPVVKKPEVKKDVMNEQFHEVLQREGLYDVFAPSGALGIVVDTTKDGPAVHSLKQTSPMLGLINPGDLIVGLDAQDTRSMTAATLTRLMASKSNQKERKITLLAIDNY